MREAVDCALFNVSARVSPCHQPPNSRETRNLLLQQHNTPVHSQTRRVERPSYQQTFQRLRLRVRTRTYHCCCCKYLLHQTDCTAWTASSRITGCHTAASRSHAYDCAIFDVQARAPPCNHGPKTDTLTISCLTYTAHRTHSRSNRMREQHHQGYTGCRYKQTRYRERSTEINTLDSLVKPEYFESDTR